MAPSLPSSSTDTPFDLFVIGGGVNGCGIARDAAGRGLRVGLAEMNDLGSATSSASTKLFHGGLRYLEYFELGLVRKSLIEREVLLQAMPHISWPMRFVLPLSPNMRFESSTPTSRLLAIVMPWAKGRRPDWLIRLGLWLYDSLGGRKILPATATLDLRVAPEGAPLKPEYKRAFEYSDCWVEDARLVVLNARDAADRGATILTRTKVTRARRDGKVWVVDLDGPDGPKTIQTRALVNAAGPWAEAVLRGNIGANSAASVRLVRGSHIVTRRLYDHDKCYFFQGEDGRIIFAIPYEGDFTLIGTTDVDHTDPDSAPEASAQEIAYLCDFASRYFTKSVTPTDVVWTYSGVRPLYDDGAAGASAATRDYVLDLDTSGPPVLTVFGGKITTYRKLAQQALAKLDQTLSIPASDWTAKAPLPGGDFAVAEVEELVAKLQGDYPFLTPAWAKRLIRAYGTDAWAILDDATSTDGLGRDFGATLTAAEVSWLKDKEFARTAEDILWRRTKLGLRKDVIDVDAINAWLTDENAG
ncbi:MAG: glycerol-3-phosphate dehydrogenase [Pseudomonadota bacterium]